MMTYGWSDNALKEQKLNEEAFARDKLEGKIWPEFFNDTLSAETDGKWFVYYDGKLVRSAEEMEDAIKDVPPGYYCDWIGHRKPLARRGRIIYPELVMVESKHNSENAWKPSIDKSARNFTNVWTIGSAGGCVIRVTAMTSEPEIRSESKEIQSDSTASSTSPENPELNCL